jgi:transposase
LLDGPLWQRIEPLLPAPKPRRFRFPGRKPLDDRKVLTGILFVLKTGIPWKDLPCEMGCGSGMTCLNRLKEWHRAGVWQRLQRLLLSELRGAGEIDWSRAAADASSPALGGGEETGPNPTGRSKLGSKHHILSDGQTDALDARRTTANVNEVTERLPLVAAVPPVGGKPGHPRQRHEWPAAGRASDSEPKREQWRRGSEPSLPKRRAPHGPGLGVIRWVERTLWWFHGWRKLRLRTGWRLQPSG